MPTSKTCLPDVNVWLALASSRHVHSQLCSAWLESVEVPVVFCRITQMGFLRLLTNSSVMGVDVLSSKMAWRTYRTMLSDERISFMTEPPNVEVEWLRRTVQDRPVPKVWTDAYLAAFAQAGGMRLVTLDKAASMRSDHGLLLSAG